MNLKIISFLFIVVLGLSVGIVLAHGEVEDEHEEEDCGGTTPCIAPDNTPIYVAGAISLLGIAGIAYYFSRVKRGKRIFDLKNIALYSIILLIAVGLGYSVYLYYASPQVEGCTIDIGGGVVVHCHFDLYIDVCEQNVPFGWELGDIDSFHAHKDSSLIHYHPPYAIENLSAVMNLQNVFNDFGLLISSTSFQDPIGVIHPAVTGESCQGGVYATFNGIKVMDQEILTKTINDGDLVRVVYGP
jgi:hypothetical protein